MTIRTTANTLKNAAETLKTSMLGYDMVRTGDPNMRMAGLRNLVVFGRAVTNVLQNLRSTESTFDDWYAPFVEEMKADPVLNYFYEMRTEILKTGSIRTTVSTYISNFSLGRDLHKFGPPPPGARSFFIGDQLGGTGWEVPQPDGSTEKYYVNLPGEIGTVCIHLVGVPQFHLGKVLTDTTIEALSEKYLRYLENLLQSARATFGKSGT